jgi:hypothetical protein
MAIETKIDKNHYVQLTRKEAVDIIGLLAAQLANETLIGNQGGACPDIVVQDKGHTLYRMVFVIERI